MKKDFFSEREEMLKCLRNAGFEEGKIEKRRSGRTTGIALEVISWCLKNPNKPMRARDHHNSKGADENLLDTIWDIIRALDLQGFHINKAKKLILFSLNREFTSWDFHAEAKR